MSRTRTRTQAIGLSCEPLTLTTTHPFGISYGTSSTTPNILVKLSFEGVTGYGECAPTHYHGETPATATALLESWAESDILGDNPFAIAEVMSRLDRSVTGHYSTKAGVELALHDLGGKIAGLTTRKMLGLDGLAPPMTDFTIGIDSLDMVEQKTKEAVEAGYKLLKVKQGTDFDREIIKIVRRIAPEHPLRVDANGAWTPKQAIEMSEFLANHNVQFIEQPLPKAALSEDFRFVRQRSPVPIYADESVCRANDVARLAGCIDGVVVKLAKTGGILEAIKVINTARAHDMKLMFGCMIESSVGVTAAVHISALVDDLDLDGALLLADDPFDGAVYRDGYLELPDRPGLGVIPSVK